MLHYPHPGAQGLSFSQPSHFRKAPMGSSHQDFILGFLLTAARWSTGPKCAPLTAAIETYRHGGTTANGRLRWHGAHMLP